ncbi:hypothetical protein FZEAL_7067 [Fusarium zealandicum]|uniref:Ig-like domain-containing protein n=1 Tax=Fusarium zealandicum TaxID=1053134 RepID=A0A8H4XI76_9HYPO|nr:hypothetical protein FZEAL_7067 [Fusarium zealandicum]
MKLFTTLATAALFAAQAHAACTRVPDAEGNALSTVEQCVTERNAQDIPTGRFLCAKANAWLRNGGNWVTNVFSPDKDVTFRIVPYTEGGALEDQPIYYSCTAGTSNEPVWTRDGTAGAWSGSIVA